MDDWEPSKSDIAWMEMNVSLLAEGGVWGIPATGSVFTLYHSKKTYKLEGDREHILVTRSMKVLGILGWKEEKKEGLMPEKRYECLTTDIINAPDPLGAARAFLMRLREKEGWFVEVRDLKTKEVFSVNLDTGEVIKEDS